MDMGIGIGVIHSNRLDVIWSRVSLSHRLLFLKAKSSSSSSKRSMNKIKDCSITLNESKMGDSHGFISCISHTRMIRQFGAILRHWIFGNKWIIGCQNLSTRISTNILFIFYSSMMMRWSHWEIHYQKSNMNIEKHWWWDGNLSLSLSPCCSCLISASILNSE